MTDATERREAGSALIMIGLGLLLADLLVLFFAPAAWRLGRASTFIAVIVVLAIAGLGCVIAGRSNRRRAARL